MVFSTALCTFTTQFVVHVYMYVRTLTSSSGTVRHAVNRENNIWAGMCHIGKGSLYIAILEEIITAEVIIPSKDFLKVI